MKLAFKKIIHSCIGLPYECIESHWTFQMEIEDLNGDKQMLERFNVVTAEQRIYTQKEFSVDRDDTHQWFKGSRTNTFYHPVKDKQKREIIRIVNDFIVANDDTPHVDWKPINIYEQ